MIIYPAIDILNGNCVRLFKGDYSKVTEYSKSPLEVAVAFSNAGATHLHIVDLDGAKTGLSVNTEIIKSICSKTNLLVQTGGGIRSMGRIKELIDSGADKVVLGTVAIKNPELVKSAVKEYKEKIVVGIDVLNNKVSVDGWTTNSNQDAISLAIFMKDMGVSSIVYTDISKDGTLEGPNIKALKDMIIKSGLDVIASGGIKNMNDIREVEKTGAYAVITGKAIYEGKISLKELFA